MDPGENLSHKLEGECDEKVSGNAGTKEACLLFHAPEVQQSRAHVQIHFKKIEFPFAFSCRA